MEEGKRKEALIDATVFLHVIPMSEEVGQDITS